MEDKSKSIETLQDIIAQQRYLIDDQVKVTLKQGDYIGQLHSQIVQLTQLVLKERAIERAKSEKRWAHVMKMVEDSRLLDSVVNYFSRKK